MRTMILPYLPEAIPDKFYPLETLFSHASKLSEQSPSAEFLAPYYCDGHTEETYKIDNIVKVAKNEEGEITLVPDDMDAFFVDVKDGYFSLKKNVKDANGENVVVDWDGVLFRKPRK